MNIFKPEPESYQKKKQFKFGKLLGDGTFGEVKRAIWTAHDPPIPVAVKVIKKKTVKGHEDIVYDEMDVLKGLEHPNIVKLHDWFESKVHFYLVFEGSIAEGGELFDRIYKSGKLTENDAVTAIRETLKGVAYLHSKDIVHRDLKPENLIYRKEGDSSLVIVDFGIAKHLHGEDEVLMTMCGSPGYAAPEVLNKEGHGKAVDLWSVGIIAYTLLAGFPPFRAEDRRELIAETTRAKVAFPDRYFGKISKPGLDFIKLLVQKDPKARPTAEQALQHEWLTEHNADKEQDISHGLRENWNARTQWRSAYNTINAINRMKKRPTDSSGATASTSSSRTTTDETPAKGGEHTDDEDDEAYNTAGEEEPRSPEADKELGDLRKRTSAIVV